MPTSVRIFVVLVLFSCGVSFGSVLDTHCVTMEAALAPAHEPTRADWEAAFKRPGLTEAEINKIFQDVAGANSPTPLYRKARDFVVASNASPLRKAAMLRSLFAKINDLVGFEFHPGVTADGFAAIAGQGPICLLIRGSDGQMFLTFRPAPPEPSDPSARRIGRIPLEEWKPQFITRKNGRVVSKPVKDWTPNDVTFADDLSPYGPHVTSKPEPGIVPGLSK